MTRLFPQVINNIDMWSRKGTVLKNDLTSNEQSKFSFSNY